MSDSSAYLKMFLACSFAKDKVGTDGFYDSTGISDWELALKVKELIEQLSSGRIAVHITADPYGEYISTAVRREIASSDLMLCLFTRRTHDSHTGKWLTSSYVVSEGACFWMQLPHEEASNLRLFGIAENDVARDQLGIAFHGNKTIPRFARANAGSLKEIIQQIVSNVLSENVRSRDDVEYLNIDKTVTVCRNAWVKVETRHRFRFTKVTTKVSIPHSIWRVSRQLASMDELLRPGTSHELGLLRVVPLDCGPNGKRNCRLRIAPADTAGNGNEKQFTVEVSGIEFQPGEELNYAIVWEYPSAFDDPSTLEKGQPNSCGLRSGERGVAQQASLTVMFERDLDSNETDRILEEMPKLYQSPFTALPSAEPATKFWHSSPSWKLEKVLKPCAKNSGGRHEVYRWRAERFSGMAKLTFEPHLNYFQPTNRASNTSKNKQNPRA